MITFIDGILENLAVHIGENHWFAPALAIIHDTWLSGNSRYGIFARIVNILMGTSILIAGLYLLYLGF